MSLVWESRELMAVRTAFRRLLARSASIQTVQLALYATVSGVHKISLPSKQSCIAFGYAPRATTSSPSPGHCPNTRRFYRLDWQPRARCSLLASACVTCMCFQLFYDFRVSPFPVGLATATIWPVAVLNCATLIDSAWDVSCLRAESGGKLLANMLAARLHGDRPVVLLGVSVGARLVYYCLLELYKLGARANPSCIAQGCARSWHIPVGCWSRVFHTYKCSLSVGLQCQTVATDGQNGNKLCDELTCRVCTALRT